MNVKLNVFVYKFKWSYSKKNAYNYEIYLILYDCIFQNELNKLFDLE